MQRQLPKALQAGDCVAVIAPASAARDADAFARGLQRLRGWGLTPEVFANASASGSDAGLGWPEGSTLAAADDARLADLQRALDEPQYRAIFCVRGGYGTSRILPRIDWTRFRQDPKPIIGYSDITALLAAAWRETATVSFHGPMVATADSMDAGDACWQLQRDLTMDASTVTALAEGSEPATTLRQGTAEGHLVGGNLAVLQSLIGTRWQTETAGAILFLEDVGEAPYRVDRMLTQLDQCGFLSRAAGIALGDFHVANTQLASEHPPMLDVLKERLAHLAIPIAHGFPYGHRPGSWTLPFGAAARLTAPHKGTATLEFLGPSVR
ncbi:MAG: LD-carboxypeptidase [Planctomycetota bacterium]